MRFVDDDRKGPAGSSSGRTMEAIGAGLPRCATSSLQAAFQSPQIGMAPCMHMAEVAPYVDRLELVLDCMRETDKEKRMKLLHRLFDGYAATCDFPGIMFIDDLMDMYPDAAIVLNQRPDARVWQESFRNSLGFFMSWRYYLTCFLWKTDRLHWWCHRKGPEVFMRNLGEPSILSPTFYETYNNWVRAEARKRGRPVLEFQATDGYPALCKFLGKPAPPADLAFPRLNDAKQMRFVKRVLVVRGLVSWAALGATLWAGWKYGPGLAERAISMLQSWISK